MVGLEDLQEVAGERSCDEALFLHWECWGVFYCLD